jgi:butyrate kinase
MDLYVLALNPGSTSTKIAVYKGNKLLFEETLRHSTEELAPYARVADQYEFRKEVILQFLRRQGFSGETLSAVVGRGGLLRFIPGGTYAVNDEMIADLQAGNRGEHASNLGGLLARELGSEWSVPSYIVDPVVVDELEDIARLSGHPLIARKSIFHALNQKAVAKRYAAGLEKPYDQLNLIVAHLGGGISVGAHCRGRVIDVNNALDGEGPFSPERSGGLPAGDLVKLCFSGKYTHQEVKKMITGQGGMVAYLGTNDGREVRRRIDEGDIQAKLVYDALAYQVAKEIGSMAAVLKGQVDAVLLTGGLAYDREYLIPRISERVAFIARVVTLPGEDEMSALTEGALRVLRGEEQPLVY